MMTAEVPTTDDATGEGIRVEPDAFDLDRHDDVLTLVSPRTGDHRTFRIRSIRSGKLAGKRIAELLTGPGDYEAFGFVADGQVNVWNRLRGEGVAPSQWERFADLLNRPTRWSARGVEYLISLKCRRCGRDLTHPDSIADGLGPHCRQLS